jgi:hypothetical protein
LGRYQTNGEDKVGSKIIKSGQVSLEDRFERNAGIALHH